MARNIQKTLTKTTLLGLVAILFFLGLATINTVYAAASLYLTASTTTVYPGSTFTVYPRVNTGGAATNAYTVNISYTPRLSAIGISKGGSICSLYTSEPSYTASTASISCGLPSPGYTGSSGGLGSITFRALSVGTATVSISGSSEVLANDGAGTNILGSTSGVTINIINPPPPPVEAPTITCTPGGDGVWVSAKEVTCTWSSSDADGYSFIITKDQNENPPSSNPKSDTSKKYSDLEDGIYYVKVKAYGDSRWSNVSTYTLKIDTTPPENLEIVSEPTNEGEISIPPMISFNATDATSGVNHYELKIDDGEWITTTNPYQFQEITTGQHIIFVKAVDEADNERVESITINITVIDSPVIINPGNGSYVPIGEELVIEGTFTPDSIVYIYLDGELLAEVTTDAEGKFSYTYDVLLKGGKHELYAIGKNSDGILTEKSETTTFTTDIYAIQIGRFVIPSICAGSILLLILILLIVLATRALKKLKAYQAGMDKAKDTIEQEFDELERDVRNLTHNPLERKIIKEVDEAENDIGKAMQKVKSAKEKSHTFTTWLKFLLKKIVKAITKFTK